jgi:hypothetical protein
MGWRKSTDPNFCSRIEAITFGVRYVPETKGEFGGVRLFITIESLQPSYVIILSSSHKFDCLSRTKSVNELTMFYKIMGTEIQLVNNKKNELFPIKI